MRNLRRNFESRADLEMYLQKEFAYAANLQDKGLSPRFRGGRAAAEEALAAFTPKEYAGTRNFLSGSVSRLSPYIRHGVITLSEVLAHVRSCFAGRAELQKFTIQLAWRDYWQRVHHQIGSGVWRDQEPAKTGVKAYEREMPVDWGATGLACMDGFAAELESTGYLHNHARMWVASYLVHWRRVAWQEGARWFLRHLLDGDPASNNLSWQWVASTFSSKPYFFTRENLERYTGSRYCDGCARAVENKCPFDKEYDTLAGELFPIQIREATRTWTTNAEN